MELKKTPRLRSSLHFFDEQLNSQISYSVTKCHILEIFLNRQIKKLAFLADDDPIIWDKFHDIRLEALHIARNYKEWLALSQAIHLILKKYDVEKYLINDIK